MKPLSHLSLDFIDQWQINKRVAYYHNLFGKLTYVLDLKRGLPLLKVVRNYK